VLDDGYGGCVGYCIGAPDVFKLARNWPIYIAEVLASEEGRREVEGPKQLDVIESWNERGREGDVQVVNGACLAQLAYCVEDLLLKGVEGKAELVSTYRAIMHIDILAPWQGQGWGRKLIERFVMRVAEAAMKGEGRVAVGRGVQIGIAGENKKVVPFYEKCGFEVYPGGEKEGGNVWMVKEVNNGSESSGRSAQKKVS
jgi:GNAT superfamily N-acetyltransferase